MAGPSALVLGPAASFASMPGPAVSPASSMMADPVLSPVVRIIEEYLLGATSFEEEIKHLRAAIRDKNEILAINVKHNMRFIKQQRLIWDIIKLESEAEEVQLWEDKAFIVQAILNSLQKA